MKKSLVFCLIVLTLLVVVGCKPAGDMSYIDEDKLYQIEWEGSNYGGILASTYEEIDGVIYVEDYYEWFGSIKGWIPQKGNMIIKSPAITITEYKGGGKE